MSRSFFVDSLLDLSANTSVKSVKEKSHHFITSNRDKDTDEKLALRRLIGLSDVSDQKMGVDYRHMFAANKLDVNHFDNRKSYTVSTCFHNISRLNNNLIQLKIDSKFIR